MAFILFFAYVSSAFALAASPSPIIKASAAVPPVRTTMTYLHRVCDNRTRHCHYRQSPAARWNYLGSGKFLTKQQPSYERWSRQQRQFCRCFADSARRSTAFTFDGSLMLHAQAESGAGRRTTWYASLSTLHRTRGVNAISPRYLRLRRERSRVDDPRHSVIDSN